MGLRQLALVASAAAIATWVTPAAAWEPEKAIEFVVPYSAGGGSDVNARMLVDTIRKNDLVDQNIMVLNKPGGSGAVGNTYTFSKKGDGHVIQTFNSGQMMSTISNDAAVKLENLTPLGTLALDTLMLVVSADGGAATYADLVAEAKAEPQSVTVGGAARGSEDNLVFTMLNDSADIELQYVPFEGGGEILAALLGGHIDAAIANPSEVGSQVEAGRVKVLGTFSEERLGEPFSDVPTFIEQGYPEVSFTMFRGYAGPPEMPEEAVAYWNDVLKKASETEQWKNEYVAQSGLIDRYMDAAESKTFYMQEEKKYRALLEAAGFLQ